jgi:hypothetical protein
VGGRGRWPGLRFQFLELPGTTSPLGRPVVPVEFEDLEVGPQLCLIDTGTIANRFGAWLARAAGIELDDAPEERLAVAGVATLARHARADLTIAGRRYEAPVTFCEPWPFAFNLLGQEGFLRYFRVTICAKEFWLDVEPERDD